MGRPFSTPRSPAWALFSCVDNSTVMESCARLHRAGTVAAGRPYRLSAARGKHQLTQGDFASTTTTLARTRGPGQSRTPEYALRQAAEHTADHRQRHSLALLPIIPSAVADRSSK